MGIYNGAVLRSYSKGGLISAFGKMGAVYYNFARGIDAVRWWSTASASR